MHIVHLFVPLSELVCVRGEEKSGNLKEGAEKAILNASVEFL